MGVVDTNRRGVRVMIAIIGICALAIGLLAGFALGRRPPRDAAARRELRHLRATAVATNEDRARTPYPHTANPGDSGVGF